MARNRLSRRALRALLPTLIVGALAANVLSPTQAGAAGNPTRARLTFGSASTCNAGNSPAAVTSFSAPAGDHVVVRLCVFDADGGNVTNSIETALQMTPVDGKQSSTDRTGFDQGCGTSVYTCTSDGQGHSGGGSTAAEGQENDTNGDNFFEQVDGDPGNASDGTLDNSVEAHTERAYTIVGCWDADNNAESNPGPKSASPCTGESISASASLNVTFNMSQHAHVRLASQVASDPTCHTGSSQASAPAGSVVGLTVCGRDVHENGVTSAHVIWRLDGFGFFTHTDDSTDSSGNATATASSTATTQDRQGTVTVCIDTNNNGICDTSAGAFQEPTAQFQITWQPAVGPPPGSDSLTLRLEGRQNTPGPGGTVRLGGDLEAPAGSQCESQTGAQGIQIHRGTASGAVVASATTAAGGDYLARFKVAYRRTVTRKYVATFAGGEACQAATSDPVAIPGFSA